MSVSLASALLRFRFCSYLTGRDRPAEKADACREDGRRIRGRPRSRDVGEGGITIDMVHIQWRIKRSRGPGARYSAGPSAPLQSPCRAETPESYLQLLDLINFKYDLNTVLLVPYGQFTGHHSQSHQWPASSSG